MNIVLRMAWRSELGVGSQNLPAIILPAGQSDESDPGGGSARLQPGASIQTDWR